MPDAMKTFENSEVGQTIWVYQDKIGHEFECEPLYGVPPFMIKNSMAVYLKDESAPLLNGGTYSHISGKIVYSLQNAITSTPDGGYFGRGSSERRGTTYNQLFFGGRGEFKAKVDADMYSRGQGVPFGCEGVVTIMKSPESFDRDDLTEFFRFLATGISAEYLASARIYLEDNPAFLPSSGKIPIKSNFYHIELMLDERSINADALDGAG